MKRNFKIRFLVFCIVFSLGCGRGWTSTKPPIHLNQNMDTQPKYKPYRKSEFFSDKSSMRPQEDGTVARGELASNHKKPAITEYLLRQGKYKFNTYCGPCHGENGIGNGTVAPFLMVSPTNLTLQHLRKMPIEYFFNVISNGIRSMPDYGHLIPVDDRWAIAFHVLFLNKQQAENGNEQNSDNLSNRARE